MNYGSLSQFAFLIIAVAIIFTYIQPTFASIAVLQDSTEKYQTALDNVSSFNSRLTRLIGDMSTVSATDKKALDTYLPAAIDEVQVMADIVAIARQSNVSVISLAAEEVATPNFDVVINGQAVQNDSVSLSQDFSVQVSADYDALKQFLAKLGQNKYPLEVAHLQFGATVDTGNTTISNASAPAGSYEVTLRTYAYTYQN